MAYTIEELQTIRDLPDFLRSEHCYNDMQHAMLVILFRHAITALQNGRSTYGEMVLDNLSLYFFIHFLNEEEGMVYKVAHGLMNRDHLAAHSEQHVRFLEYWREKIFAPYKTQSHTVGQTLEETAAFYNLIIEHIDQNDLSAYGPSVVSTEQTRTELSRIAQTNMPMSPFMSGAYDTLKILDQATAELIDCKRVGAKARAPIGNLNLIPNVGPILSGSVGSLRDRFVAVTRGDQGADRGRYALAQRNNSRMKAA